MTPRSRSCHRNPQPLAPELPGEHQSTQTRWSLTLRVQEWQPLHRWSWTAECAGIWLGFLQVTVAFSTSFLWQKGVQEGWVLPLLNQRQKQKVWGALKGEEGGRRDPFLPDCNYIPASEAKSGEVCRVKPQRFDKQAFPWLCCQHADRQHSSFGTELLQWADEDLFSPWASQCCHDNSYFLGPAETPFHIQWMPCTEK